MVFVFTHYINIVNVDQKMTSSIQSQFFLALSDLPVGIFYRKGEEQSTKHLLVSDNPE
jgi:hypothetical protein